MRSVARAIDGVSPKKARDAQGIEGGERGYRNAGKACATFENRFHPVEIFLKTKVTFLRNAAHLISWELRHAELH